ncbi:MAG: WD40 repeat domain-containing protein [Cyanobacteria bacterium J06607_10]
MAKQILTELSTHTVHLGSGNDQFEVMVSNLSDRFATFAVDVSASGLSQPTTTDWYQLTPDLSAKIPAGDRVNFVVSLLEVPPIPGGFTGKMNLNVKVTCLELGEEDRQLVNLVVAGSGALSPRLSAPVTEFEAIPGNLVELPLKIHNPNRNSANLRVLVKGLPYQWLTDGHERRIQVAPQGNANVLFICQPPLSSEAKAYPFEIEVLHPEAPMVGHRGTLSVLPTGWLELGCVQVETVAEDEKSAEDEIGAEKATEKATDVSVEGDRFADEPLAKQSARKLRQPAATNYVIELNNRSNLHQSMAVSVFRTDVPMLRRLWARIRRQSLRPMTTTGHLLQLSPAQVEVGAGDRAEMTLVSQPKAPWLGWRRKQTFEVRPQRQQTDIQPQSETIEVSANPKIPFWAQCLAVGCFGMGAIAHSYFFSGHRAAVNSVQFDGQANAIISGSDDHTVHRWQVANGLQDIESLKTADKSIRVVHYRPLNNNILAAGLENGEIQIWDFLSQSLPASLTFQRDDRVFDLQFSPDSRSLYSAHGSGHLLKWDVSNVARLAEDTVPAQQKQFDFAIQAIALTNPSISPQSSAQLISTASTDSSSVLAVGGRFNRLVLWDAAQNQEYPLDYPAGEPNDYISSIDTAENALNRMATADTQGRITLWNLSNCISIGANCRPVDLQEDAHRGEAVNAVSLSSDACYLVSGGEDGRVNLWSLNHAGQVVEKKTLARFRRPVNSVDIVQQGKRLMVVSGGENHRVRLHRARDRNQACS